MPGGPAGAHVLCVPPGEVLRQIGVFGASLERSRHGALLPAALAFHLFVRGCRCTSREEVQRAGTTWLRRTVDPLQVREVFDVPVVAYGDVRDLIQADV